MHLYTNWSSALEQTAKSLVNKREDPDKKLVKIGQRRAGTIEKARRRENK